MVGWLDGTWSRVMAEFGEISSRRCEVFASFVPPPPPVFCELWHFLLVWQEDICCHTCGYWLYFCMCTPHILLIVLVLKGCCFGGRKVFFWWWERLLETSHLCALLHSFWSNCAHRCDYWLHFRGEMVGMHEKV